MRYAPGARKRSEFAMATFLPLAVCRCPCTSQGPVEARGEKINEVDIGPAAALAFRGYWSGNRVYSPYTVRDTLTFDSWYIRPMARSRLRVAVGLKRKRKNCIRTGVR